jgi:hypothetical protein
MGVLTRSLSIAFDGFFGTRPERMRPRLERLSSRPDHLSEKVRVEISFPCHLLADLDQDLEKF